MTIEATPTVEAPNPVAAPAPAKPTGRAAAVEVVRRVREAETGKFTKPEPDATPAKTEGEKPKEGESSVPKLEPPKEDAPKTAHELAVIARENRKILAEKDSLKKQTADLTAREASLATRLKELEADLALAKKIRSKDFTALKEVDEKWYETATKQEIASRKPGSTEALALKMEEQLKALTAEISELKKPKTEKPKEEVDAPLDAKVVAQRVNEWKASIAEVAKDSDQLPALKGEDGAEIAEEVTNWVDAKIRAEQAAAAKRGVAYDKGPEHVNALATQALKMLNAKVAEKKSLLSQNEQPKVASATVKKDGESGAAQPQQINPRQTTITASLQDAVPVSAGPRSKDERRLAAKDLLRRQRESEA